MKVERASVRFVGQWVLASTLGWIGGLLLGNGILFLVIRPIGRAMGLPVVGIEGLVGIGVIMAGVGTGVGIMQSLVLRRQFSHGSWWVLASTIGWVMGGCLGGTIGWNMNPAMVVAVVGAVAGFGTGIMQWFILRRQFSHSSWWVLASTVAWGGGMAAWAGGTGTLGIVGFIALIGGLIVAGTITGIALVWLMRPQEMRFRQKLGYMALVSVLLIAGGIAGGVLQLKEKKEINALIQQLGNEKEESRWQAAKRLEMLFGGRAKDAVPALIELLNYKGDPYVRQSAASALGSIGKSAKDAVPALMESLNDESEYVRIEAASALGQIDKSKLDVVLPLLIEALGSENREGVRHNATNALRKIGTSEALKAVKEYQQK